MKLDKVLAPIRVGLWVLLVLSLPVSFAQGAIPPDELIRTTTAQLFEAMKADKEQLRGDPDLSIRLAEEVVLPHADFRRMSQWVLGRDWRSASDAQKDRFVAEFRALLVRTYGSAMSQFLDKILTYEGAVEVLPLELEPGATRAVVHTRIRRPDGGPPVRVDYRVHTRTGQWLVYDVTVEGISLVSNYRSTFHDKIARQGLDALIAELTAHNEELQAQAGEGATTP